MVSPINANWESKRACQCISWFKVSGVTYSSSLPLPFSCSWLVALSVTGCYLSLRTKCKAKRFTQLLMNRIPFLRWRKNATSEEVSRAIKHLISHTLMGCRVNINWSSNLVSNHNPCIKILGIKLSPKLSSRCDLIDPMLGKEFSFIINNWLW